MGSLCSSAQTPQQWRDSVSVLMEQIRLHPNSIDLRLRKAEANINLLQWDYALEEYGRVLRMDSRNLAALYFRAYCYGKQHHYDLAKADYEAFLTIQPQHLEAHLGCGESGLRDRTQTIRRRPLRLGRGHPSASQRCFSCGVEGRCADQDGAS